MTPSTGQLLLLTLAIGLFAAGAALSAARLWWEEKGRTLRRASFGALVGGVLVSVGVLAWRAVERGTWVPIRYNFDTLVVLAVLLALFVMYLQGTRPVRGLDWFVVPIVVLLLAAAGFFGSREPHEYRPLVMNTWVWTHRVTSYGGALAFAVAGALGAMYVLASRRLRAKHRGKADRGKAGAKGVGKHKGVVSGKTLVTGPGPFESLERLERLTMVSVTLGFALLTVGLVTGLVEMFAHDRGTSAAKVVLATLAWLVYAVVLHAPINPRWRGRRAAMLSVVGFVLVFGTLVAVQFMPPGQ